MDPIYNFATSHAFAIAGLVALVMLVMIFIKLSDAAEPSKWDHRDE